MCTYLKNMEGYKLNDLKLKDFDSIQEMFDRAFKRVNTFEDFRTELVEGKEKRAGTELIQDITKKQKVEDDKETAELKQCLEIILDEEEVTIDAIPLVVKSLSIVDWKIYKEGRKRYYQIMRADGKSQMYMFFSQMLNSFDRGDLEDLYKLGRIVGIKSLLDAVRIITAQVYVNTALMNVHDVNVSAGEEVFATTVDDITLAQAKKREAGTELVQEITKKQKVEDDKETTELKHIYMLVEKKYPLTPSTLSTILEKKLIIDYESEMAYQLLKFFMK
ncbi:hypothetical protein Tco_1114362 [Tanacetum coccineum]|uniref:Uncharacterized protein n=1 Tax=Tanacetum coccineum TaxID=301880 RepID=A0ABQ5IV43_9ASTR